MLINSTPSLKVKQELETLSQAYGIASVNSKEFADVMDANDPLSSVRNEFHIPYAADIKQTALNPDFITNAPIPGMTSLYRSSHITYALE